MTIPNQRHLFDIPDDIAFLNCASYSPLLRRVAEAGAMGLARKVRPWGSLREDAETEVEQARGLFAGLIGATADDIAVVPSTSYAIATAAANLSVAKGQDVVVLEQQFPSNFHAWRQMAAASGARFVQVPRPADGDWASAVLERIGPETGLVALPPCHWTDGSRVDLNPIGARCREVGAAFVIDATQYAGAQPLDVAELQPDFLACSAYKWLLCPYTLAFLYAAPHRQQGRSLEQRTDAPVGNARRYDMGEHYNFINLPMAVAALTQIAEWTPAAIGQSLAPLTQRAADMARERGLAVPPDAHRVSHYIGLRLPGGLPEGLDKKLAEDNVHVALRGDAVRLSPHLFNDATDIDRFFAALDRLR
jgi:selenocysteine lyase/cysteine desulfurase